MACWLSGHVWERESEMLPCFTCPGGRNKDYSKVEDLYDTRVPLHNEDAFSHGLRFKAKVRTRHTNVLCITEYMRMSVGVTRVSSV